MKKKYSKESNYIKINLNTKNQSLNYNNNSNNNNNKANTYIKMKQKKNDSYLIRNKNIRLVKKNLTLGKITREEKQNEQKKDNSTNSTRNISLSPFMSKDNKNHTKKDELKNSQRNTISMRRLEYSIRVKDASTNKKKSQNYKYKYNIKKIITIQKWVKGFLLRSFLSNACECEKIMYDFFKHIKNYIFLNCNILQKLKTNNKCINDNLLVERKFSGNGVDNTTSISIINTNTNTNTFTNTFSLCQETNEIFENDKKLKITTRNPSIRELLMANSDNNNNNINNQKKYIKDKLDLKNSKNIHRAKSLNDIKNISRKELSNKNINNEPKCSSLTNNIKKTTKT